MKTLEVPSNRMITLPKALFKPADRVAIVTAGGVLIVRKLEPPRLSSIATRVKAPPISLAKIAREVQVYRRAKRPS